MNNDVTAQTLEGYFAEAGVKCPYYATSVHGDAWAIGQWLAADRIVPNIVRKSRGDTYRVNALLVSVKWKKGVAKIERIA